ncbi:MAG TPA: Npt1/Npt2 family nucleotide transporter [Candidatus Dependentiae bacterium]|nr:Npt1/Npt2 family nucleotide transporter [Candidatus Dependentiae bacterium]HRQ62619.1 Npt1/Npt2 family nucleotide transporter [Candidatus Dependentiae bacterium]
MGMGSKIRNVFGALFDVEPHERQKLLFLSMAFCLIIGGYTIAKELKDSVFLQIVGREYVPLARTVVLFGLMPAIFLYSKLVDKVRRYQLLNYCALFFGMLGFLFTYLLGHPVIGLPNTNIGPDRIFGWVFYFFVEAYSPFLVSVFWAFANSISSPQEAKNNYGLMVAGSKFGGVTSALIAWIILSGISASATYSRSVDIYAHQLVYAMSSCMLILVPIMTLMMIKHVPGQYLHGYEAVYQAEKLRKKEGKNETGMFAGLWLLIRYPYVLGIFGMVYFYEVVSTVLSFLRLKVAEANADTLAGVTANLLWMIMLSHAIGFLISLLGTRELLKRLGTRVCLFLIPLVCGAVLCYVMFDASPFMFGLAYSILKSINLAFSWPVRESLYIPTVKEIKFKSKSWIDAFGSKFAKTSGSAFNWATTQVSVSMYMPLHSFFFAGVVGLWFMAAYLLGRRFDRAIAKNEVIGLDEEAIKI